MAGMSLQQVAAYLRVGTPQIAHMARLGEIPFSGPLTHPLFDKEEIDAWASRRILGMGERRLADFDRGSDMPSPMPEEPISLCALTRDELVVAGLASKTKASVLADMTKIAEDAGLLYEPRDLLESLREREALCSTGLAGGVALVHPRHHDPYLASESFMVIARTAAPIHFGAPDGKPTDVFFALVMQDDRLHLRALARLCLVLSKTDLANAIREADSSEGVIEALRTAEGRCAII